VSVLARGLIAAVRVYQKTVAPWLPQVCRFTPSCSAYMAEALRVHGAFRGAALGLARLARCHPFCRHGEDPVPPRRPKTTKA